MAEFKRKLRMLNYQDGDTCKKYLRKDFLYKCAYCQLREADIGTPNEFQIDHFKPKLGMTNVCELDNYDNLFYACSSCNGKAGKSDYWSETLLNPCKDQVLNVHIRLNSDFFYEYDTAAGKEYVQAFKLNRSRYLKRRREINLARISIQERNTQLMKLYQCLLDNQEVKTEQKAALHNQIISNKLLLEKGIKFVEDISYFDEDIEYGTLSNLKQHYDIEDIDENYDLHIKISYNNRSIKAHMQIIDDLNFTEGCATKIVRKSYLDAWKAELLPIMLIFICKKTNKIYFAMFNKLDSTIKIRAEHEFAQIQGQLFEIFNLEKR